MSNQEEWRWIPEHEELYMASSFGRIRSHKRKKWRILSPELNRGYEMLLLRRQKNKKKGWYVHRLIALTFIPNPENKPCINHKNYIKNDNRVENLEWITWQGNVLHKNLITSKNPFLGIKNPKTKLTEQQIFEIRELRKTKSLSGKKLGKLFGVSDTNIYDIINHNTWKHLKGDIIT